MRIVKTISYFLAAASTAAWLTACAPAPPRMEASPQKLSQIRTITVIRGPEAERLLVRQFFSSPVVPGGAAGGLVAGVLDAAVQQDRETRLTAAVQPYGSGFASHLAEAVAVRLNAAGYIATVQSGPAEQIADPLRFPFDKIQSSADAVLVLTPTVIGLTDARYTQGLMPTTTLVATLLTRDRKEWLYRGYHASGRRTTAIDANWRDTPGTLVLPNFDAALADPAAVARALRQAGDAVAATLSADLAPK